MPSFHINATDAIKNLGTTSERPGYLEQGLINIILKQTFEGFGAGNGKGSLGGVKDVDRDTYHLNWQLMQMMK